MADAWAAADSDSDADEFQEPRRAGGGAGGHHNVPLAHFLAMIAGGRVGGMDHIAAPSNDDLIERLRRSGMLTCDKVAAAMRCVPRDIFVPENYRNEALMDAPIRVEEHEFNISAPHMHSAMIEALQLAPGHVVLDVGSGCGYVAAVCALMVGREGSVAGIDIRREAINMSKTNLQRLRDTNEEYDSQACAVDFQILNVFLLGGSAHQGRYDRIHVGACCPPDRLRPLVHLLKHDGGCMVVPVAPSDLRLITRRKDGTVTQRIINQVRFSELEVPGDADVALAQLRGERKARLAASLPPSTYSEDLAEIAASNRWEKIHGSDSSNGLSTSPAGVVHGWPASPAAAPPTGIDSLDLGQPDCALRGDGWNIAVHSAVVRQRCSQLRARCDSGMRDAELSSVDVPPEFSKVAMENFLQYIYHDKTDHITGDNAIEVIHLALYYGVPRLAQICEAVLAKQLRFAQRSEATADVAADAATSLLTLAEENNLTHLLEVSVDFIIQHYKAVESTEAFAALTKEQVALVAKSASLQVCRTAEVLKELRADGKDGGSLDGGVGGGNNNNNNNNNHNGGGIGIV